MKATRKIIRIDEEKCDGCGLCVPACAEGAIRVEGGKARLVSDRYCDGLGACLGECTRGALEIIERKAEGFDELAAANHLERKNKSAVAAALPLACGCPGSHVQTFSRPASLRQDHEQSTAVSQVTSVPGHWPVQIRLVPPTAPFLREASLLVVADCVPVACPVFHRDFLPGKVVLIGCPKFDDPVPCVEKFARIFAANDIRDVTVLVMEVPCCQGLPAIVSRGMEIMGKAVPLRRIVISTAGAVLEDASMPAATPFPVVEPVKA
jgi:ferredoxin